MKSLRLLTIGLFLCLTAATRLSAQTTNYYCTNAVTLTNSLPYSEDTSAAPLASGMSDSCGASVYHGVWFTIMPTNNERVIINTTGSGFGTALTVYTNFCGALVPAVDYYGAALCSSSYSYGAANVSFSSVSNVTYHVLVGGYYTTSCGALTVTATFTNPPANDTCAGAVALTNGVPFTQDTTLATEIGKPIRDCNNNFIGHGVWFTLQAYAGQQVTISTCGSSYNGNTDLTVYTNACGSLGTPFTCSSGGNPFNCPGNQAGLSFIAPTNLAYYILASGVGGGTYGTLKITANQPPPTNDVCLYAIPMTNGITYMATNIYATSIGDPIPSCVPSFGRGIWYSYAPNVNGFVGVTTCGSSFQTALAVYTGTCGSTNEIACSHNSGAYCNSGNADVNFYGYAGTNYLILVGGVNGTAGTLQIQIPVVDLASTGLTATNPAGGLLTAGRNFAAGWAVQNQGTNSINGYWTDQLSLSNAVTNIVIAQFNGPHSAPAGGTYINTNGGSWNLGAIPAGTYTLFAQADVGNAVAEANKSNNIQTLSVAVTNLPPSITLLIPTNQILRDTCVAVPFRLLAQAQGGSYTVTNVTFYDGNTGNAIGQAAKTPYSTNSVALGFGAHTIGAQAMDNFGLVGTSIITATITLRYPTNLNVLRADLATNGDFVGCMCAYAGSNYVVESTTNLLSPTPWPPYTTNLTTTNVLAFTNHPSATPRFFRARLAP